MKITPIDIAHKSFEKQFMGFNQDQVLDFLQTIASQMESLIQERNSLRDALREKEMTLLEYKERDQVLKNTISTATQMAEKHKVEVEREGKLIIADAQQKAEIISRDARDSLKKMYEEIASLKRMKMQFDSNMKAIAQAHISMIEQGEKFMPQMNLPDLNFSEQAQGLNNSQARTISPSANFQQNQVAQPMSANQQTQSNQQAQPTSFIRKTAAPISPVST